MHAFFTCFELFHHECGLHVHADDTSVRAEHETIAVMPSPVSHRAFTVCQMAGHDSVHIRHTTGTEQNLQSSVSNPTVGAVYDQSSVNFSGSQIQHELLAASLHSRSLEAEPSWRRLLQAA
jgi:hypothetical protein